MIYVTIITSYIPNYNLNSKKSALLSKKSTLLHAALARKGLFDRMNERAQKLLKNNGNDDDEIKTENDLMREALETKPWRSNKIKYLNYEYHPWKDNWKEKYYNLNDDSDTIHLYSVPEFRPSWERTRVNELWIWPWMWTKIKADRLSWLHKTFYNDIDNMSVQEHMELDCFFSEFDMPVRWGLLRIKELDVLNVLALNLAFFTDFNGYKPSDLGLRPDGSVKTCSVQFHNCISSSNNIKDTDHYAAPYKWSRSKSPDQAFDEIKDVYNNYPKRGLRWTSGWIDRGGWKPQEFGGRYFYAQADSLAFHYTDDIELVLDYDKREVQYRSSARIGTTDWDVQRLRYNQFARMLDSKGGWEVEQMPRLNYNLQIPYRLVDQSLVNLAKTAENVGDGLIGGLRELSDGDAFSSSSSEGETRRIIEGFMHNQIDPLIQPLEDVVKDQLMHLPAIQEVIEGSQELTNEVKEQIKVVLSSIKNVKESFNDQIYDYIGTIKESDNVVDSNSIEVSSQSDTTTTGSTSSNRNTDNIKENMKVVVQDDDAEVYGVDENNNSNADTNTNPIELLLEKRDTFLDSDAIQRLKH